MKLEVVKNVRRNLIWGTLTRVYQILVPMFIRRIFIYRLGIEYAGLGGLFLSILDFLNLGEMGAESAVLFFMYKPIKDADTETVRRLLGLIQRYYRYVGLFVLLAGLAITPFIQFLIAGDVPAGINIYIIFLMNLASAVLSYWLFAYKRILLDAYVRNDLISRAKLGAHTLKYAGQLVVLLYFTNYYLYLVVEILAKIVEQFICVFIADRKYSMYSTTLEPTAEMKSAFNEKTKALFFHKVGGIIVNAADPIVVSTFLGLAILGKYENYQLIMSTVLGFVLLINVSSQAGIGHLVAGNTLEENTKLFERYSFLIYAISSVCCCCFLNLYQPVITFWINSSMLLGEDIVVLLCIYFYVFLLMIPGNMFESASGLWNSDRYRPLLEGLLNLAMNLILVQSMGLQGVLLSTILSMGFVSVPWLYYNVIKRLLAGNFGNYIQTVLKYTAACAITCVFSYLLCRLIPSGIPRAVDIIISGFISCLVPVGTTYLLYRQSDNWKWICGTIRIVFKRVR